jgi:hypothetical protein
MSLKVLLNEVQALEAAIVSGAKTPLKQWKRVPYRRVPVTSGKVVSPFSRDARRATKRVVKSDLGLTMRSKSRKDKEHRLHRKAVEGGHTLAGQVKGLMDIFNSVDLKVRAT